jgi:hypothetical protein
MDERQRQSEEDQIPLDAEGDRWRSRMNEAVKEEGKC